MGKKCIIIFIFLIFVFNSHSESSPIYDLTLNGMLYHEKIDNFTDDVIRLAIYSNCTETGNSSKNGIITIRNANNLKEIYFTTIDKNDLYNLSGHDRPRLSQYGVIYRFDDNDAVKIDYCDLSKTGKLLFLPLVITEEFISDLEKSKTLLVRLFTEQGQIIDMKFENLELFSGCLQKIQ